MWIFKDDTVKLNGDVDLRYVFTTHLMNEARRKFYSDVIVENSSNQRNLFSATKRLLNQGHEVPFPPTSDKLVTL